MYSSLILALALSCGVTGCGATRIGGPGSGPAEDVAPPDWVITGSPPEVRQWPVCAVGFAGPTYFRADGVEAAVESARNELARTLQIRIETSTLDIQTEGGDRRASQTVIEVSSYVLKIVLEGSTIIGVWYDKSGEGFTGKPRFTYALVCVDEASLRTSP